MAHIFTNDTVRIKATFKDFDQVAIDPDGQTATFKVYDFERTVLETFTAVRDGVGLYHYDWTVPDIEGTYFVEFKGEFSGAPQLTRQKFAVKFKPDV